MTSIAPPIPLAAETTRQGSIQAGAAKRHRRAMTVTTIATAASLGLFVDLLLVGHTNGDEIWGLATAALGADTGGLSLVYLGIRGKSHLARIGLYALWLTVAFFGFGGYNSHRLPLPEGTVDSRPRPPLAPLVFTGFGIAGALSLRSGSKEN